MKYVSSTLRKRWIMSSQTAARLISPEMSGMPGKGGDRLREADAVGGLGVEVGVVAELVAREEELVRMAVVDGEGEGAADVLERARAHRPERGEHELGIARLRGDAGLLGEDAPVRRDGRRRRR